MTVNDLINDVARLGFENYVEDEEAFIVAANRALSIIYIDRPVSKTVKLTFSGPKTTLIKEFIEHPSESEITIPIKGKSLSFRSKGSGSCVLNDNTGSSLITLSGNNQLTKQFVYGEGSITFKGDYYFTISNFAVFNDKLSDNTPDIPEYAPFKELCPEDYCDGFRSFIGLPCDKNGNPVDEIKLRDGRIIVPFDYRGELYLTYYRTPTPVNADDFDSVIDIGDDCATPLSLLTASFIWLDEDAAKAQYYMNLYRDLMANMKRYSTNKVDTQYRSNGWA